MIDLKSNIMASFDNLRKTRSWIDLSQNNENILKTVTETEYNLRKLSTATERKSCLGFFGESQVGKSFLVASLLVKDNKKMLVSQHLDGEPIEFLDYVNPKKETEATAVVTRFTIDEINKTSPDHFLVEFLSPGELLRCIYDGFYLKRDDANQQEPTIDREQELLSIIGENTGVTLSSESSLDFLDNYYKLLQRMKVNKKDWVYPRAEKVYNALASLTSAFSLNTILAAAEALWIGYTPNSFLFESMTKQLLDWGEPTRAFVNVSLLEKMLDADYLNNFRFNDAQLEREHISKNVSFSPSGPEIMLEESDNGIDLSYIQILAKEVVLNVLSDHSELLGAVDGLDFPGVKPLGDKDSHYSITESKDDMGLFLLEVIKIGKLKHLFTLYIENRDLTNVLLCIQEGEQNPTQISYLIRDYIQQTMESTSSHALDTLYTVMTKTDILFSQDVSEDGAMERWNTRFTTHFGDHYEEVASLSRGDERYKRVFLILNPNAKKYEKSKNLDEYQKAYMKNPYVSKYLYNKDKNWDSLMSKNGGVEFLHETLSETLLNVPDQKIKIIREAFSIRLEKMVSTLSDLIPPEDEAAFVKKRKQEAQDLLETLFENPLDFERLLASIPEWVPAFSLAEIMIEEEPEERRERRNSDIFSLMNEKIISLLESNMLEKMPLTSAKLMSIDESTLIKFGERILAQARSDDSIRAYLERNRLSFRLDDTLSEIAFNQSVFWLVCGLIYNLWETETVFEEVNLEQPLDKYYPSDAQQKVWKKALPKIYLMGRDEKLPPNMDELEDIIHNFEETLSRVRGVS